MQLPEAEVAKVDKDLVGVNKRLEHYQKWHDQVHDSCLLAQMPLRSHSLQRNSSHVQASS